MVVAGATGATGATVCEKPAINRKFKFRDNLADAGPSAPRNIAEEFGRKTHREFARFCYIARGSEQEVLDSFIEAHQKGYIDAAEFDRGDHAARKALKVLNGLIAYLDATPDWLTIGSRLTCCTRCTRGTCVICFANGEGEETCRQKKEGRCWFDRIDRCRGRHDRSVISW